MGIAPWFLVYGVMEGVPFSYREHSHLMDVMLCFEYEKKSFFISTLS
jgi:hypothetical protein